MINRFLVIILVLCGCSRMMNAQEVSIRQETDTVTTVKPVAEPDTVIPVAATPRVSAADSTVQAVLAKGDSLPQPKVKMNTFKPEPNKALLYALVPGLGQIYNRKYWKLPLVYGAFMGCMYAITWNNKNYGDYSTAYFDIMEDYQKVLAAEKDKETYEGPWGSWTNYIRSGTPLDNVKNTQLQDNLKRRKDYFRRYRDLSIIITVGVYAISIIDAYVDAQLFDFDISPDLSLHWTPEVTPKTRYNSGSYGLNCSLKF